MRLLVFDLRLTLLVVLHRQLTGPILDVLLGGRHEAESSVYGQKDVDGAAQ